MLADCWLMELFVGAVHPSLGILSLSALLLQICWPICTYNVASTRESCLCSFEIKSPLSLEPRTLIRCCSCQFCCRNIYNMRVFCMHKCSVLAATQCRTFPLKHFTQIIQRSCVIERKLIMSSLSSSSSSSLKPIGLYLNSSNVGVFAQYRAEMELKNGASHSYDCILRSIHVHCSIYSTYRYEYMCRAALHSQHRLPIGYSVPVTWGCLFCLVLMPNSVLALPQFVIMSNAMQSDSCATMCVCAGFLFMFAALWFTWRRTIMQEYGR